MDIYEYIETEQDSDFNIENNNFRLLNPNPKISLLRGIVGSVKLKNNVTNIEFLQCVDYLSVNSSFSKNPFERITNYLSEDLSVKSLNTLLTDRKFLNQNKDFFKVLNQEFNNFYYYQYKESYTTAFAFVYRILEKVSYAFPLMYAAKTEDFIGTYKYLKSWMGNASEGELAFFKNAIKKILCTDEHESVLSSTITIDITADSEEIQEAFFGAFKKACSNKLDIFNNLDQNAPHKIEVKFGDFSSFIICLRNRFFHLKNSGEPNLDSDDILDADSLFKLVNEKSIYWISFILFEVLKHSITTIETFTDNKSDGSSDK